MFAEIAPRYDLLNHVLSLGIDVYWRWRTVRDVPPVGDAPILDVCTGTGDLALAYRRKAPEHVAVIASDFTREMLVRAAAKSDRRKPRGSMTYIEADTLQLPFADNTFQVVSVAFGLRNVADTSAGLAEMTRVCRPGGHVAVLEFSTPSHRWLGGLYRFYFRNVLPRVGQLLARNRESAYHYLPESVAAFPEGEVLKRLMGESGLTNVTSRTLTFGIATLYVGEKPAC